MLCYKLMFAHRALLLIIDQIFLGLKVHTYPKCDCLEGKVTLLPWAIAQIHMHIVMY